MEKYFDLGLGILLLAFSLWAGWIWTGLACVLLFVVWLFYAIKHLNISKGAKWGLAIGAILLELLLLAVAIFCMFFTYDGEIYLVEGLFLLQLILFCLYRVNRVHRVRLFIGALVGIALAIYVYFNGSVMGDGEFLRTNSGDYEQYRIITYLKDVLYPFTLLWNLAISPFWRRK